MKYANRIYNKRGRRISIRALLLMLALMTSIAIPTVRPVVSQAQASGTVVGWGENFQGQATPPADLIDVTAISGGGLHSLALKSDGTVVGWGDNSVGQATPPAGLSSVVAISAGLLHSLALKTDGTVVGWGDNSLGQTTPPAGLSSVVAISAGSIHNLALKSDGTVVGWGDNFAGGATPPAGLNSVVAISAGIGHNLALKTDGTVVGWGFNDVGQATPPAGLNSVVAISAAGFSSLALKTDGTVVGWGLNDRGQATPPAGLTGVMAISAGRFHSLALKTDGTVVGWGLNDAGQTTPPAGLSGVVAISAGQVHSLALTRVDNCAPHALYRVISGPQGSRNNFTGTVGSKFTVGANVFVDKLGFEDQLLNGLASPHQVGLWNSSGTLLASVTVQSGTGSLLIGNWRYETLPTPVKLTAGSTYIVGAQVTNGGDKWTDNGNFPIEFAISQGFSLSSPPNVFSGGGFTFPNLNGTLAALRWAPANLQFTTCPITLIIARLQDLITAGTLTQNQGAGLIDKLNQVSAKLDQDQTAAACNQLNSFISQVNAFINNHSLSQAQGQALIDAANAIKADSGCP